MLTSAVACGCQGGGGGTRGGIVPRDVDAGPVEDVAREGVSSRFRDQGFFLVRRGESVLAVSSLCTHRNCKLDAAGGRSFVCPCHGSEFDAGGHVLTGPAGRDLPVFATSVDERGHLIVHVGRSVAS